MTNRSLHASAIATAIAIAGCGSDEGGTTGAMGQSQTEPDCAPSDQACLESGLDAPLAVGARLPLDVRVTARGVAAPKIALETAREDVIGVDRGMLVGKAPGWSSVMFLSDDGLVLDFVTLSVEAPDRIDVFRSSEAGTEPRPLPDKIQVAPGDDFEIGLRAFSGITRLLGDLEITWRVDSDIVSLLDAGKPSSRRLRIKSAGTTTLTMQAAGFSKTVTLEVLP